MIEIEVMDLNEIRSERLRRQMQQRRRIENRKRQRRESIIFALVVAALVLLCVAEASTTVYVIKETAEVAPVQQHAMPRAQIQISAPVDLEEETYYDELELLALCTEAEAGNQGLLGKRMVVDVILNRVEDDDWPDTIEGVISKKYQFSSYWDGAIDRADPTEETFEAVRMELKERMYTDIYYFTAGEYSKYGTPWKQVGDHYFSKK